MARAQPSVDTLLTRFDDEVDAAFYPFLVLQLIEQQSNPAFSEIRQAIAALSEGKYVRSEASDKQLIGRMDKTFGLIDCVGGETGDRRFRLNKKGSELLNSSREQVLAPLLTIIATGKSL